MDSEKVKKLLEKIEKAIDYIELADIEESVKLLKLCESKLELGNFTEGDLHMLVYHNLSLCSQFNQEFEDCFEYLEKTIKIAKLYGFEQDVGKIRNLRYVSMLYIQQCAILSHLGEHESAVSSAKQAFNFISECFGLCVGSMKDVKDLCSYNYQNLKTLRVCLEYLAGKLQKFPDDCGKVIQRSSLGVLHFTEWIYSFGLSDLLDVKPLKYFEIKNCHTFLAEISKDFMLEKICLLLTSCYLIATESRQLSSPTQQNKAKNWHFKALEIGSKLLPLESPLLQHIKSSYEKHYPVPQLKPIKSKSKTPVKIIQIQSNKSRTPLRTKMAGQRKIIKNLEPKTERSHLKDKLIKNEKFVKTENKVRTFRDHIEEPEPQISEDDDDEVSYNETFVIFSNELYGGDKGIV